MPSDRYLTSEQGSFIADYEDEGLVLRVSDTVDDLVFLEIGRAYCTAADGNTHTREFEVLASIGISRNRLLLRLADQIESARFA